MIFNKEKRIKYVGFNDAWFMTIGILLLSFITFYLFTDSFLNRTFSDFFFGWVVSLFFSIFNWIVMRSIMIYLRKKFPAFKDDWKRISLFFISIILTILSVDAIGNVLLRLKFGDAFHPASRSKILLPVIIISTMTLAIYEAIYFYIRLKQSVRQEEQTKRISVQAQLDALRNQAQPHFFFNSLNTLRDIIDHNSKEEAGEFVDKLSDVYRFILDSGTSHLISLRDELKFARSYMHIQTERFGENLKVNWDIPAEVLDQQIVPMSLQLLLENAIKHNVVSKAKPLTVNVFTNGAYLYVENQIQEKSSQLPSTKVGLENIQKRYALISEKVPEVNNNGYQFIVSIPLLQSSDQLNNHAHTDR